MVGGCGLVTLRELLANDMDRIDVPLSDIVVAIAEEKLLQLGLLLNESQWIPSAAKGLWLRIDPPRPEMKQRRHAHITQTKYIRASGQQASWNDDQTRHDRKRFNTKFGARADVQAVAKSVLGLLPDALLEHINLKAARLVMLLESAEVPRSDAVFLSTALAGQLRTTSAW